MSERRRQMIGSASAEKFDVWSQFQQLSIENAMGASLSMPYVIVKDFCYYDKCNYICQLSYNTSSGRIYINPVCKHYKNYYYNYYDSDLDTINNCSFTYQDYQMTNALQQHLDIKYGQYVFIVQQGYSNVSSVPQPLSKSDVNYYI